MFIASIRASGYHPIEDRSLFKLLKVNKVGEAYAENCAGRSGFAAPEVDTASKWVCDSKVPLTAPNDQDN